MKRTFLGILLCIFVLTACSQPDSTGDCHLAGTEISLPVGQSAVGLRQFNTADTSAFLLLQLHSNEVSAGEAAYTVACREGIEFLQVLNNRERMITFRLQGRLFQFDPNRIFSTEGIRKTLQQSGAFSPAALAAVQGFRDSFLTFVSKQKTIVAVHNNTNGRFNIRQYLPGGIKRVHINDTLDADDFFITNDEAFFNALKAENLNVVWEDASRMEEDGSLSLYCQRHGIRYVNVEAEHGHEAAQLAMLEVVKKLLTGTKKL